MLTPDQIDYYHQNGYVTPDYRVPNEILDDIRFTHDRFIEKYPQFVDYCPASLAYDTAFLNFARIPEILDMVAQLIGDDIALWNSSFFAKPAKVGTKTPWHQDGEYWPIRPLATCTVWIAVDASKPENGCLRVIPGSHQSKRLAEHQENTAPGLALSLELKKSEFNENDAHDIILEPGQISLHDVFLFHGSEANHSENSRRGMTLRYMPTTSVYDREIGKARGEGRLNMGERTLYLVRGKDASGKNDFRVRY
ncbi:MAG: phytanoyl-CoA dioxygenase family protein [Planctomycetota bacterium]|nr:phytanoyl-CoA dioxygenase family protein [Planctomycetota bacterium]